MTKSTFLAAATTVAILFGALAATTGAASAEPYGAPYFRDGYGWQNGPGKMVPGKNNPGRPGPDRRATQICKPVFKTIRVRGHHGWQVKTVAVGERCVWQQPRHR